MSALPEVRLTGKPREGRLKRLCPRWARYPLAVYLASRMLFFLIAVVDAIVRHATLRGELSNWDGYWYIQTAAHWYPHLTAISYPYVAAPGAPHYTTLGFMPLYPGVMWVVGKVTSLSVFGSGLLVSMLLGVVATLAVCRLALEWWGETPMRRAAVFWSLWPGTIVFSMVYSEALTVSLIAGAFLLMTRRRWLCAGLMAGAATAVEPLALAVIPACLAALVHEARERGWTTRPERRALLRPLAMVVLSGWGAVAFAVFLWRWTGSPLASYDVQSTAWSEHASLLAIPHRVGYIITDLSNHVDMQGLGPGFDLNDLVAVLGAIFLLFGLWRLWKWRDTVPVHAIVYSVVAALILFVSGATSPNPRTLLCAFPVLITIGVEATGRRRVLLLTITVVLTLVMSWLTFVGEWMLP